MHFEIVTVVSMHGVTADVTVGKTLDKTGKVAEETHTGVVLDEMARKFSRVADADVYIADPTPDNCRAEAWRVVNAVLNDGGKKKDYTLASAPVVPGSLHIRVPGEGWVPIGTGAWLSNAFQLQVDSTKGPVDQKAVFYVNGNLMSFDVLVVVQTP